MNNHLIKIITLFSTIYLVANFFIPAIQHLLWLTALLIFINYALSLTYLFHQGKITVSLVILNVVQLGLFCHLHWLIYDGLGAEHYSYVLEPRWYDWVELVVVHVLRAVDLLDALGAYGIHLQNVIHQSTLAGMALFGMHIMVDIFLLGAVLMLISRRSASQQATTLMKMQRVTERFKNSLTFFKQIRLWAFLLALVLIIVVGTRQHWHLNNWFLWPLDNVLRTLDFGDAFQIFDWQLHSIEMGFGLATLAVFFRLVVSFYAFGPVNRLFLFLLGGRGKTTEELVRICTSPEYSEEDMDIAFKALLRFETKAVIPHLITILNAGQLHFRRLAAEALEEKGSRAVQAIPSLVIVLTDDDSSLRLAAKQALNKIEPQWQQHETIQSIIPQLVNQLFESQKTLQKTLILSTLKTIEPKSEKTVALLRQALTKNEVSEIRVAAIDALGKLGQADKAIPELLEALTNDASSQLRVAAIDTLENIKPTPIKILSYFVKALNKDPSPDVRQIAAKKLGKIDTNPKVLPHLVKALVKDNAVSVRQEVAKALGSMGLVAVKSVPYLVKALADTEVGVRKAAISTLPKIDPKWYQNKAIPKLIPYFVKIFTNVEENPERRIAALLVLQRTISITVKATHNSNIKIILHLIKALSDQDEKVRRAAIITIDKIKLTDTKIVSYLFDALSAQDEKVRRAAILALKRSDSNLISENALYYGLFDRINSNYRVEIRYDIAKTIDTLKLIKFLPKDKIDTIVPNLLIVLLDNKMNSIVVSIFKLLNEIDPQWAKRQEISDRTFYDLVEGFKARNFEFDHIVNNGFSELNLSTSGSFCSPESLYKQIMKMLVIVGFFNIETVKILNQMDSVAGIAIMLAIENQGHSYKIKVKERREILWKLNNSIEILDPEGKWRQAYRSYKNMMSMDF
ncbi:HEAT domain containing protein [Beggiatoa sp. PS]|nr:HEAT domain containing protein [Beggiatoa sp. PS]